MNRHRISGQLFPFTSAYRSLLFMALSFCFKGQNCKNMAYQECILYQLICRFSENKVEFCHCLSFYSPYLYKETINKQWHEKHIPVDFSGSHQ